MFSLHFYSFYNPYIRKVTFTQNLRFGLKYIHWVGAALSIFDNILEAEREYIPRFWVESIIDILNVKKSKLKI